MLVFVYTKKTIEVLICNPQNFHCVVPFHCFFNQNVTGNNFRKYYINCQKIPNLFGKALETGRMRLAFLACFPEQIQFIFTDYVVFCNVKKPKITLKIAKTSIVLILVKVWPLIIFAGF